MFNYTLIRSQRRTLGIEVNPQRGVLVRAPRRMSEARIEAFVDRMAPWALKHLAKVQQFEKANPPRCFASGEFYPFLGESLPLRVNADGCEQTSIRLEKGEIVVDVSEHLAEAEQRLAVKDALTAWYRRQAGEIFAGRVALFGQKTGLRPACVKLRRQKQRWGSCTAGRTVIFNWLLVMAPLPVVDYVVAHELCHLKVLNHSKDFWRLLGGLLPDYQASRKWLRANGRSLHIL